MADLIPMRMPAPTVDRFALGLRLAALEGERRAVAAARTLPEIDLEIAAVRRQLDEEDRP